MLSYLTRRLTESFLVLAVMSFRDLRLIGLMPGDPDRPDDQRRSDGDVEDAARLRAIYGLDRRSSSAMALLAFGNALTGDFGYSRLYGRAGARACSGRAGVYAGPDGHGLVLSLLIAMPAGIVAAMNRPRPPPTRHQPPSPSPAFRCRRSGSPCC
jgi:peptide/nickel transport system permease protein